MRWRGFLLSRRSIKPTGLVHWSKRAVAGGWQVYGIMSIRSGTPLLVTSGRDNRGTGTSQGQRPDLAGGVPVFVSDYRTSRTHAYLNRAAFAVATPRLQRARQMIVMMQTLNKNYFGGATRVTCFTCHRGAYTPETTPRLALQYGTPDEDPNMMTFVPDTRLSATQILDKYVAALGGADRVARLTSYTAKGTYSGFDTGFDEFPVEFKNRIICVVERKHGTQMLFELRASFAVVRSWISVLLPVVLHPVDDQLVVDLWRLTAQHEINLERLIKGNRVRHVRFHRPLYLKQQARAESTLQSLPICRFGS